MSHCRQLPLLSVDDAMSILSITGESSLPEKAREYVDAAPLHCEQLRRR